MALSGRGSQKRQSPRPAAADGGFETGALAALVGAVLGDDYYCHYYDGERCLSLVVHALRLPQVRDLTTLLLEAPLERVRDELGVGAPPAYTRHFLAPSGLEPEAEPFVGFA